ncbi:dienelactone hydrolase family protein [Pseudoxanthomonas putridarboris]|uniref:Dienelactone hydrolase family protein n=1 Tax=Pseudoxanthomonas putridarboris TaxID=752605 RepID=A0ABU9IXN6_9GAMM
MRRTSCLSLLLAALWAPSALAAPKAEPIEWTIGQDTFAGYLVYDDAAKQPRPGLVMVPNWQGVNESALAKARQVAGDDYVVLVADVYGKMIRPKNDAEAGPVATALREDRPTLRARIRKAVEVLKQQPPSLVDASRIGAFGFCFGGSTVLELARGGDALAGIVSLHGGLATDLPAEGAVESPVLVLNGADDSYVSAAEIAAFEDEMKGAGADWQFVNFSGAVHCFAESDANNPPGCVYHERSAKRAYRMMADFFRERFAP